MPQIPEDNVPIIYAVVGLVGFISCFAGYRLFKLILAAILSLAGAAALGWVALQYGGDSPGWTITGLVIGAVVGGLLAHFFYVVAVGTLASLCMAILLMQWIAPYPVQTQLAILGAACLVAALAATALTTLVIMLASGVLGAFLMVHSALYFITGQTMHRATEAGSGGWELHLNLDLYLLVLALVIGVMGFLIQRRAHKPKPKAAAD